MKNIVKFVLFLIYTIGIFFISSPIVLCALFLFNIIMAFILKIDFKKMGNNLLILLPFILFTIFINILFESIYFGVLIGIRLIICYNITYIFSKIFTIMEFAYTIEKMCLPFKIFKVDTKNIGIIISISICMIPVFKNQMQDLIKAMKSKGQKFNIKNISVLMKPVLIHVLQKTTQIEKTLISEGYVD